MTEVTEPRAPEAPAEDGAVPAATRSRRGLPSVRPEHAALLRRLFSRPRAHVEQGEAGPLRLRFGPPGGLALAWETVELQGGAARALLRLYRDGHAQPLDERAWSDYRGRARLMAWALAHDTLLGALARALGEDLLPVALGAAGEAEGAWLAFRLDGPEAGACSSGAVCLPTGWLERLAELHPAEAPPPPGIDPGLPAPVALRLRTPPLAARRFARLGTGDVVVLGPRAALAARVRAVPLHGGAHWLVEPVAEGWRAQAATEDPFPVETVMDDVQNPAPEGAEAPAAPDAAAVAAALPVQLEFELGRCAMTLGELGALQPGYVFPLPLPAEGANVVVRANGREVARGEVVAVGETLGVRLLNWLGPAHGLQ